LSSARALSRNAAASFRPSLIAARSSQGDHFSPFAPCCSEIHEWAQRFEPIWQERFDLLEEVVQELKKEEEGVSSDE
jgi:hypothetical protein